MNQLRTLKNIHKIGLRTNLLKFYSTTVNNSNTNFNQTVNKEEIEKFKKLSDTWWDNKGPFEMLHLMNPCRIEFVVNQTILHTKNYQNIFKDLKVLDVGCGGGLVSEALARLGAQVTAIDAGDQNIQIAKLHQSKDPQIAEETNQLKYRAMTTDQLIDEGFSNQFDIVCCFEVIEHVDQPDHFMTSLAQLVKPGGQLFMSTINRSPKAFLGTIMIAEYLLKLVPPGTHDYSKYITPEELQNLVQKKGLKFGLMNDIVYNPIQHQFTLESVIPLYPLQYLPIIGKELTDPMNYVIQAVKPLE